MLNLEGNRLGAAAASVLAPALQHTHCRLTELCLQYNGLGQTGVASVEVAMRAESARALVVALQRLLFAVALRADSPHLLLAGGRVDLTQLDASHDGSPLPRAGTGGLVQYLDPSEVSSWQRLEGTALFARKAAAAVGARFEVQQWAWRSAELFTVL